MLITLDESHRQLVHQVRDEAGEWLATKGTDQYRGGLDLTQVHANIDHDFDRYPFVGWVVDGRVVAMMALIEPEPDFWSPEELAEPQTYISRFFVLEHGKGYGSALLEAVIEKSRREGKDWVRLNCWTTNTRLHEYYKDHGFDHVRDCDVAGRMSGALFQLYLGDLEWMYMDRHALALRVQIEDILVYVDTLHESEVEKDRAVELRNSIISQNDLPWGPERMEASARRDAERIKYIGLVDKYTHRSRAQGRAILDRILIASNILCPNPKNTRGGAAGKKARAERAERLRQFLPEDLTKVFDTEELRNARNDYEHMDERLDTEDSWIEIGGPLVWRLNTQGNEFTVDLVPALIAAEGIYQLMRTHGENPLPLKLPSEWLAR